MRPEMLFVKHMADSAVPLTDILRVVRNTLADMTPDAEHESCPMRQIARPGQMLFYDHQIVADAMLQGSMS